MKLLNPSAEVPEDLLINRKYNPIICRDEINTFQYHFCYKISSLNRAAEFLMEKLLSYVFSDAKIE